MFKAIQRMLLPVSDPIAYIELLAQQREVKRQSRRLHTVAIGKLRELILKFGKSEQLDMFSQPGLQPVFTPVGQTADAGIIEIATTWSDREITALCDGLVSSALEGLRDNKSIRTRRELFEWMAPAADADVPFSFESCCAVAGFNPENIRMFVGKAYREEILEYVAADEALVEEAAYQRGFAFA